MSTIKSVDAKTLNKWIKTGEVLLIDVREPMECKIAKIAASENIPLSQICLEDVALPKYKNKKIVMQCRSGVRSMSACEKLEELDPSLELYNLAGGILAWKNQGYDTVKNKKILPLDRQVQVTLGVLITLGMIMSYFFGTSWTLIPIIIGLGLINAGLTGSCGMTKLVALFPWNNDKK